MAQGKKYTEKQKTDIIESLKPYLLLDYDLKKAHTFAFEGLREKYSTNVPDYTTVAKWVNKDSSLSLKIDAWKNSVSCQARKNWSDYVYKGEYTQSKDWLERREKPEWSTRQEITGADGEGLIPEEAKGAIDKLFSKLIK